LFAENLSAIAVNHKIANPHTNAWRPSLVASFHRERYEQRGNGVFARHAERHASPRGLQSASESEGFVACLGFRIKPGIREGGPVSIAFMSILR
jgi:hypothetical protein